MDTSVSHPRARSLNVFLLGLAFAVSLTGQTPPGIVNLSPADNIQAAVTAAPEGTTFVLQAGVYRMLSVVPKNNDIFTGTGSVTAHKSCRSNSILREAVSGLRMQQPVLSFMEPARVPILCADTVRTYSLITSCRPRQAVR